MLQFGLLMVLVAGLAMGGTCMAAEGANDAREAREAQPGLAPLPEGERGIAAKHPGDVGIASDPAVIVHENFEEEAPLKRWDNYYARRLVSICSEPTNVHAGSRSVQFLNPRQEEELSNAIEKVLPEQDAIFLRYYSKFDTSFDAIKSSHNGCMVLARAPGEPPFSPGVKADGRNKFDACFECWRGDEQTKSPGELNVYCYHPEQLDKYGDHFFPNGVRQLHTNRLGDFGPYFVKRENIIPELGRWYCYEIMVKANTPGQRDGRIACWLDGKLIADFPNLRLRDVETVKINRFAVGQHIKNNPRQEARKWYDDIVVASEYIGPMSEGRAK